MPPDSLFLALAAALALGGCAESVAPDTVTVEWPRRTPAEAGFDPAALDQLVADIGAGEFPNTHALLIEHDGALVLEQYFSGSDERWGNPLGQRAMGPDSLHDLRSVSKSVTSILVGMALSGDLHGAVERPLRDYLPAEAAGTVSPAITLHHALTMTAGLEWNEMTVPYTDPTNDEIAMYASTDPVASVLSHPMAHEPGTTWYYSGGLTQVLAGVVAHETGQSLSRFVRDSLFEPLGITTYEWLGPEAWGDATPAAMSGLRMRARDMAKLGSLYLHGGRWQGRQVVPREWVEMSTARHVPEIGDWSRGGLWGYGYQWWVGDLPEGARVIAAVGNGNQRIFVVPSERLVVTVLAGEYNRFEGHSERILDRVLAAR